MYNWSPCTHDLDVIEEAKSAAHYLKDRYRQDYIKSGKLEPEKNPPSSKKLLFPERYTLLIG